MVEYEFDKLLDVGFSFPVSNRNWVSPIVMVPKRNGEICLCKNFRKLSAVKKKDHFPLPFPDSISDAVAGLECYSFLDGFSGYNQVHIGEEDNQ